MRLHIRHETRYAYSAPVFLEPHTLRLKPATNAYQRLLDFGLSIEPAPDGLSHLNDYHDNECALAWFGGQTDQLSLTSTATVETPHVNPFDYIWTGPARLPLRYDEDIAGVLAPYRQSFTSEDVQHLADVIAASVGGSGQAFLPALAGELHARLRWTERVEGEAMAAEETLGRGEGSCRDLAVLFMAMARSQGYAARFVSGYQLAERLKHFELHAWAEVYLPGGGWRGFDPTTGLSVADRHVALAVGTQARDAAPVSGSFRGSASAQLHTTVEITRDA